MWGTAGSVLFSPCDWHARFVSTNIRPCLLSPPAPTSPHREKANLRLCYLAAHCYRYSDLLFSRAIVNFIRLNRYIRKRYRTALFAQFYITRRQTWVGKSFVCRLGYCLRVSKRLKSKLKGAAWRRLKACVAIPLLSCLYTRLFYKAINRSSQNRLWCNSHIRICNIWHFNRM